MRFQLQLVTIKIKQLIENFQLRGIGITLLLVISATILGYNIFSVIERGRFNYETYVYERDTLGELRLELDESIDEYDYVTSEEYQELLLRDAFSYALPGQTLFREDEEVSFVQPEEKEYYRINEIESYSTWWRRLLF